MVPAANQRQGLDYKPTGTLHAYRYLNSPLHPFKHQIIKKDNIKTVKFRLGPTYLLDAVETVESPQNSSYGCTQIDLSRQRNSMS